MKKQRICQFLKRCQIGKQLRIFQETKNTHPIVHMTNAALKIEDTGPENRGGHFYPEQSEGFLVGKAGPAGIGAFIFRW